MIVAWEVGAGNINFSGVSPAPTPMDVTLSTIEIKNTGSHWAVSSYGAKMVRGICNPNAVFNMRT